MILSGQHLCHIHSSGMGFRPLKRRSSSGGVVSEHLINSEIKCPLLFLDGWIISFMAIGVGSNSTLVPNSFFATASILAAIVSLYRIIPPGICHPAAQYPSSLHVSNVPFLSSFINKSTLIKGVILLTKRKISSGSPLFGSAIRASTDSSNSLICKTKSPILNQTGCSLFHQRI